MIKQLKKNLKKHLKLTTSCQIQNVNKATIILDMPHLKTEAVEEVVLVILIFLVLFQIYLKTFLEKALEVEDVLEDLIIEALT